MTRIVVALQDDYADWEPALLMAATAIGWDARSSRPAQTESPSFPWAA